MNYNQRSEDNIQQNIQYGDNYIEEASLQDRVDEDLMQAQVEQNLRTRIQKLKAKTQDLHADQQFLKQQLKCKEQQTLKIFSILMQKKKILMNLISNNFNKKQVKVDISLRQQLDNIKKTIKEEEETIQRLRQQLDRVGLAGIHHDQSGIKIKTKIQQIESQIKVGRKFSSTQYVRDYIQRPQVYKVNYQQAKYQYQTRAKLKQCLQKQKAQYLLKKQQINGALKEQIQIMHDLQMERDSLLNN